MFSLNMFPMILITHAELWIIYGVLWVYLTLKFRIFISIKNIDSDPEKHIDKYKNVGISFQYP